MLAHQIKVHKSTDTKTWLIEIYGDRDNGGDPSALQSRSIGGILVVLIGHKQMRRHDSNSKHFSLFM